MDTSKFTDATDATMSMLGVTYLAYIKQVDAGFGVFAADGTPLAVFESKDAAYYTARQHNLDPLSIH